MSKITAKTFYNLSKKIVCMLLSAIMLLSIVPPVFAEEDDSAVLVTTTIAPPASEASPDAGAGAGSSVRELVINVSEEGTITILNETIIEEKLPESRAVSNFVEAESNFEPGAKEAVTLGSVGKDEIVYAEGAEPLAQEIKSTAAVFNGVGGSSCGSSQGDTFPQTGSSSADKPVPAQKQSAPSGASEFTAQSCSGSYPTLCQGSCWGCNDNTNYKICCPTDGSSPMCMPKSHTCLSNGCTTTWPTKCNGVCYGCADNANYKRCCPTDGSSVPNSCVLKTSTCSANGCSTTSTRCNNKCWNCDSGLALCCPNSGDPTKCCSTASYSGCQKSDGTCADCRSFDGTCNGNKRYYNSYWNVDTQSCWSHYETCTYGCSGGACIDGKPDLKVSNIYTSPSTPEAGVSAQLYISVSNVGTAGTSNTFYTKWYVDGEYKNTLTHNGLEKDSTTITPIGITFNVAKTFIIRAVTDTSNSVTESDEGNNDRTLSVTPTGYKDLKAVDIWISPASPNEGDTVNVYWKVDNSGTKDITETFYTRLYHKIGDGAFAYVAQWYTSGLLWNQYAHVDNSPYQLTLTSGLHTFKIVTDATSVVSEKDETDNTRTESFSTSAKPNLIPYSITATPAEPVGGQSASIRFETKNTGTVDAGPYSSALYIGSSLKYTCTSTGRPAGTFAGCNYNTDALSAGTYSFKMSVDINNQVAETNEYDNDMPKSITWKSPAPDITVSSITFNPSSPQGGQSASIKFTLKNIGVKDATSTFYTKVFFGDELKETWNTPGLAVNAEAWGEKIYTLGCGAHTIRVETDVYGNIAESDETNNAVSKSASWACNSCNGGITSVVKTSSGTSISSAKVYDNGAYRGLTGTDGRFTFSTTATYCPDSHEVTIKCSDDTYCNKATTAIDSNLDTDELSFVCDVCSPKKLIDLSMSLNKDAYCKGDTIRTDYQIRDLSSGALLPYADLSVYDPFTNSVAGGNIVSGTAYYETSASKTGYYEFVASAAKSGYETAKLTRGVSVSDCTGKIIVDVDDNYGAPLQSASVYLDSVSAGTTDSAGQKTLSGTLGRTYNVGVDCPNNGNSCGSKSVYVDGTEYLYFGCDCRAKTGDASLQFVIKEANTPISNVYVYIDGVFVGTTDMIGLSFAESVKYGTHTLDIYLKAAEKDRPGAYVTKHGSTTFTIDSSYLKKRFLISSADLYGASQGTGSESSGSTDVITLSSVDPQIAPVIALIFLAITVAMTAWDAGQLYGCSENAYKNNMDWWDECWDEGMWLAVDFIPTGVVAKYLSKGVVWAAKGVRFLPAIGTYAKAAKKVAPGVFEYGFKYGDDVVEATVKYSDDGASVLKITKNAGQIIAKHADDAAKLTRVTTTSTSVKIGDKAVDLSKFTTNPGNNKGILGEVIDKEFLNIVKSSVDPAVEFSIKTGSAGQEVARGANYVLKYGDDGKRIMAYSTSTGKEVFVREFADVLVDVSGKPVVVESTLGNADVIIKEVRDDKMQMIYAIGKDVFGVSPEIIFRATPDKLADLSVKAAISNFVQNGGKVLPYVNTYNEMDEAVRVITKLKGG